MKRIWRLKNSSGPSFMVVAKKESIERLALHFKIVKDIKNLGYSDITDGWEQYPKEAIKEVCLKAPEGVAGVEMDATSFTWTVCGEKGEMWKGTKGQFNL